MGGRSAPPLCSRVGKLDYLIYADVRNYNDVTGEDVSVPINVAYNHHYAATLLGEGSHMERVPYDPKDPRTTLFTPEPGYGAKCVSSVPAFL